VRASRVRVQLLVLYSLGSNLFQHDDDALHRVEVTADRGRNRKVLAISGQIT